MKDIKKINLPHLWTILFFLFFLSVPLLLSGTPFIAAILFFVLICICIYMMHDTPKYALCLFLLAFAVRLIVILIVKTPAVSDFGVLLDASRSLIEGDLAYLDTQYFRLWSYQNGFVFFQSLLLRIWNSVTFLKLFNCFVCSATVVLVFYIANEFADRKAAQTISLVYCLLPFPLFYTTILSNQFFASFLVYLGIYILISSKFTLKTWLRYLLFAVLLSLANAIRPESIIPLFSAILYLLLTITKRNWKEHFLSFGILVAVYFVLNMLISGLFVLTGLSPNGLTNNAPHWKFVLGFNHETMGRYSDADGIYLNDAEAAWEIVKSRIFVPISQLCELFAKKIKLFWKGSDLGWTFNYCAATGIPILGRTLNTAEVVPDMSAMSQHLAVILYILALVGSVCSLRGKNYNSKILLLLNQVFVTFGVYLLIEVQARYSYHVQISIAILAALGLQVIARFFSCRYNKRKQMSAFEDAPNY